MIALIDANNFFVSCERAVDPTLLGQPVIVLSSNDGCVISRSNEVKDLGVPMGAPYWQYRDIIDQHQIKVYSVNFDLYQHFSNLIVRILMDYCAKVQVYSVDESFVLVPNHTDPQSWAVDLRDKIYQYTTIPVSIGIASTKTLAKLAAHIAKDHSRRLRGNGVEVLCSSQISSILEETFIGSVWGIGPRLAHRMRLEGIKTAADLVSRSDEWVRNKYGIVGLRLKYELSGVSSSVIATDDPSRQGISSTRSFGRDVFSYTELYQSLLQHVQTATRKLRRQKSVAGKITIFIRTGRHKAGAQYYAKASDDLLVPTNNTLYFNSLLTQMLQGIYRPGFKYYRSGVFLSGIESADNYQLQAQLFNDQFNHHDRVMPVVDMLQAKYGQHIIRPAALPLKPGWIARANFKSPSQSLKQLSDLPILHTSSGQGR